MEFLIIYILYPFEIIRKSKKRSKNFGSMFISEKTTIYLFKVLLYNPVNERHGNVCLILFKIKTQKPYFLNKAMFCQNRQNNRYFLL